MIDVADDVKDASVEERLIGSLPLAHTLDVVMSLILNYVKTTCQPKGNLLTILKFLYLAM